MKAAWVSVVTAVAASVCCIGPVVAVTAGASALTAVAVRFEPFRQVFLMLTVALLGFAFHRVYRPSPPECAADARVCHQHIVVRSCWCGWSPWSCCCLSPFPTTWNLCFRWRKEGEVL